MPSGMVSSRIFRFEGALGPTESHRSLHHLLFEAKRSTRTVDGAGNALWKTRGSGSSILRDGIVSCDASRRQPRQRTRSKQMKALRRPAVELDLCATVSWLPSEQTRTKRSLVEPPQNLEGGYCERIRVPGSIGAEQCAV